MPSMHLLSQFGLCLGFSTLVSQISASPVLTGLVNDVNDSPARIAVEVPFVVPDVSKDTDTSTIQPDADGFSPACLTCHEENEEPNADAIFNTTTEFISVDQTPPDEDLLYVPPSKTIGEPATNVKRARGPPTETRDHMTHDFALLRDHFPWYRPFRNDKIFAMALKSYAEGDPKPHHYGMAAGPVKMTTCWRREYSSQDRRDFKWVFERSFDWEAQIWDMDLDRDNPPNVIFIKRRRGPSAYVSQSNRWRFLGRVKDRFTPELISEAAQVLVDDMNANGGYCYLWNNCRDFAYYLFSRIGEYSRGLPDS